MRRLATYAALAAATLVGLSSAHSTSASGSIATPTLPVCWASDGSVPTPTLVGTRRNDDLIGTPGDDVILGLAGNDHIEGRGGDDIVCGSEGRDRIYGGPGRDVLDGADVDIFEAVEAGSRQPTVPTGSTAAPAMTTCSPWRAPTSSPGGAGS